MTLTKWIVLAFFLTACITLHACRKETPKSKDSGLVWDGEPLGAWKYAVLHANIEIPDDMKNPELVCKVVCK